MEIEVQSLPLAVKTQLAPRIKTFKDEVRKFKTDLKTAKQTGTADRDVLLAGSSSARQGETSIQVTDDVNEMHRERLMRGNEKLQDGSRRLEEAQRIALETGNFIPTFLAIRHSSHNQTRICRHQHSRNTQ